MEEINVQMARRIVEEGFGGNNPSVIDELASNEFIEHQRGMQNGKESTKAAIRSLRVAFPDLNYTHINSIANNDLVCVHYRAKGTHKGNLGPMPPTGKQFQIDVIDIMRFTNGKLTEHWGTPDRLGMLEDLGLWPPNKN